MSADKYDTNQPILILVRRGRGGRGFLVSPVDSPTDVAGCSTANEVGDVVLELLDDEKQPRVNIEEILAMAAAGLEDDDEDEEDEEDEEPRVNSRANGERSAHVEAASDSDEDEDEDGDGDDEDEDDEDKKWWDVKGSTDPADAILVNVLGAAIGKAQKLSNRKAKRRRRRRTTTKKPSRR